ncbi:hypothetical protein BsWGS_20497 [Bradybaena similaris]
MLDNWLEAEEVHKDFMLFHQIITRHKMLSSVPSKMAVFLNKQKVSSVKDFEEKGTAYYNASRDIFALGSQPGLEVRWKNGLKEKRCSSRPWKYFKPYDNKQRS